MSTFEPSTIIAILKNAAVPAGKKNFETNWNKSVSLTGGLGTGQRLTCLPTCRFRNEFHPGKLRVQRKPKISHSLPGMHTSLNMSIIYTDGLWFMQIPAKGLLPMKCPRMFRSLVLASSHHRTYMLKNGRHVQPLNQKHHTSSPW